MFNAFAKKNIAQGKTLGFAYVLQRSQTLHFAGALSKPKIQVSVTSMGSRDLRAMTVHPDRFWTNQVCSKGIAIGHVLWP